MAEPPDTSEWDTRYARVLRTLALVTAVILAILAYGTLILLLIHTGFEYWQDVFKQHFIGTIGLVGICAMAFGIVIFLRQSEGPIEFEAIGMKFKGAAGHVILWGFCVIVLSLCARVLW
jgi:hypothetical protein